VVVISLLSWIDPALFRLPSGASYFFPPNFWFSDEILAIFRPFVFLLSTSFRTPDPRSAGSRGGTQFRGDWTKQIRDITARVLVLVEQGQLRSLEYLQRTWRGLERELLFFPANWF